MNALRTVDRPPHVDPALVVDFDFWRPGPLHGDPFQAWTVLHGKPPLVWTPHNGGHWIVTRGEDIPRILNDYERFSSRRVFIGMDAAPRAVPLEQDPPEHGPLRKLLQPAFSPRAVKRWSEEAHHLAVALIEGLRPAGRCEFVSDFAHQLPIVVFLKIVDLPLEDRSRLLRWVGTGIRASDTASRDRARASMNAYIVELVDRRLAQPGDDILSQALQAGLGEGRRLSYDLALGLARTLLGGGLDSVASTMAWIALFLAENPQHRQYLAADRRRIPRAIERDAHRHSTLSHGIHRCIGAPLAIQEIRIFIEEWLARIGDFTVDPDTPPVMVTGIVHGLSQLGLKWAA